MKNISKAGHAFEVLSLGKPESDVGDVGLRHVFTDAFEHVGLHEPEFVHPGRVGDGDVRDAVADVEDFGVGGDHVADEGFPALFQGERILNFALRDFCELCFEQLVEREKSAGALLHWGYNFCALKCYRLMSGLAWDVMRCLDFVTVPTKVAVLNLNGVRMKKTEIAKFKKILEERRKEILSQAATVKEPVYTIEVEDLADEVDLASSESDQSMNIRLRDREQILLRKINKALDKIEGGTYGTCESCGEDISVRRMEARPVTDLCIRCKEEQERVERSFAED